MFVIDGNAVNGAHYKGPGEAVEETEEEKESKSKSLAHESKSSQSASQPSVYHS